MLVVPHPSISNILQAAYISPYKSQDDIEISLKINNRNIHRASMKKHRTYGNFVQEYGEKRGLGSGDIVISIPTSDYSGKAWSWSKSFNMLVSQPQVSA